jgi:hypothetical protein
MMRRNRLWVFNSVSSIGLGLVLLCGINVASSQSPAEVSKGAAANSVGTERDLAETREQLFSLLRMSPTLTEVVKRDPSLLSNQEYVTRNNPQLGRFLQDHPEVVRNPDFYLFANFSTRGGRPGERMERRTWMDDRRDQDFASSQFERTVGPFLIFVTILGSLLWLIRVLLENRRWGRIFKMQTEVHGRLIERFGNNEELLTYMTTDAGKRFLEAAPIPIDFERDQRIPAALSRVLVPLQIGVVLTLLGAGLLSLRHSLPDVSASLLVFGIVILMPGIGFIISAGITWLLAARLGLTPRSTQTLSDSEGRQ